MRDLSPDPRQAGTAPSQERSQSNCGGRIGKKDLFEKLDTAKLGYDWAGFRNNYHTITELGTFGRRIIVVDDIGLHLLWKPSDNAFEFIKPLPREYVSTGFELRDATNLTPEEIGFLYSYTRLIKSEVDFWLAVDHGLVDERFSEHRGPECFQNWKKFSASFTANRSDDKILAAAHRRFHYGDLRLNRLWSSWSGKPFYNTRDPVISFQNWYVKWVVIILALASTILSAMQVALAADPGFRTIMSVYKWFAEIFLIVVALKLGILSAVLVLFAGKQVIGWVTTTWGNDVAQQVRVSVRSQV